MSNTNYLAHHGIEGQKWGVRRFQNEDGTLTPEGLKRYRNSDLHRTDSELYTKRNDALRNEHKIYINRELLTVFGGLGGITGAGIAGGLGAITVGPALIAMGASGAAMIAASKIFSSTHNKRVASIKADTATSDATKRMQQYINYLIETSPKDEDGVPQYNEYPDDHG